MLSDPKTLPPSIVTELEAIRELTRYPKKVEGRSLKEKLEHGYPRLYGICAARLDVIREKIDALLDVAREAA